MTRKRAPSATEKHRKKQKRKKCIGTDCTKEPSFGPVDGNRSSAIYCKTHIPEAEEGKWENVVNKRCKGTTSDGHPCKKQPSYGPIKGDPGSARYCNSCVPEDERHKWEDVVSKRCKGKMNDGHPCKKRPNYGPLGGDQKSAQFCNSCVPEGERHKWEDVRSKRCKGKTSDGQECRKCPSYGPIGGSPSSAKWCVECLPSNEQNLWENVVSKRCEGKMVNGHVCKKLPSYGPLGGDRGSARFCVDCVPQHEKDKWEDVKNKRCEGRTSDGHACKKSPSYGPLQGDRGSARYCGNCIPEHDKSRWENVVNRRCAQEGCSTQIKEKYRGYCLPCFASLFPLEPVSRNYKTKERLVAQAVDAGLKRDFTHLEVTYDKQVVGGCSKRRPDIAVDILTHVIIVECDEDGHKTDDYCTCENKRMMQLFQDYGNRPCVLIRFNPDGYTNSHGSKVASCFSRTKTGLVQLAKKEMWTERLQVLRDRLEVHLRNIPKREFTVEHLYYDGFH